MEIRNRLQEYVKEDPRFSVTYFDNTEGHIIAWEYGIPEICIWQVIKEGFIAE